MIQRIQSLLLLAVVLLHVGLYYITFWSAEHEGLGDVINLRVGDAVTHGSSVGAAEPLHNWVLRLAIVNGTITLLALVTIFLFRNRMLQLRLTRILLFLEVVFMVLMFYVTEQAKKMIPDTDDMNYGLGIGVPLICIILIFFAGQRIRHDEKLVRSADRLR
jgi:hypothetical protein